jgi:hypothetical protein
MLSFHEQKHLISQFPKNIKLCYEKNNYNKVLIGDVYIAIPFGKKCFAWFTIHNSLEVCFLMELNESRQISHVKICNCVFHPNLVLGTILFGTIFRTSFFVIEDIFWYKSLNVSSFNWATKWRYIEYIFNNEIKQIGYNNHFLIFGLPVMSANGIDDFKEKLKTVPYNIYNIQARNYNKVGYFESQKLQEFLKEKVKVKVKESLIPQQEIMIIFEVRPDIQTDIYHLYCFDNNRSTLIYYDIALIPDIITSVKLNKLFRKIKENENIDLMEESDSEDEFEDNREDKYVYLERKYNMSCQFNNKFKKWVPIEVVSNDKICILNDMKQYK